MSSNILPLSPTPHPNGTATIDGSWTGLAVALTVLATVFIVVISLMVVVICILCIYGSHGDIDFKFCCNWILKFRRIRWIRRENNTGRSLAISNTMFRSSSLLPCSIEGGDSDHSGYGKVTTSDNFVTSVATNEDLPLDSQVQSFYSQDDSSETSEEHSDFNHHPNTRNKAPSQEREREIETKKLAKTPPTHISEQSIKILLPLTSYHPGSTNTTTQLKHSKNTKQNDVEDFKVRDSNNTAEGDDGGYDSSISRRGTGDSDCSSRSSRRFTGDSVLSGSSSRATGASSRPSSFPFLQGSDSDCSPHGQGKSHIKQRPQTSDTQILSPVIETSGEMVPQETPALSNYEQKVVGAPSSEECPFQAITLIDVTSEGRKFTDEANDFSLEIPEGAIPKGERLTVDEQVALFGPFKFPKGLRPVSPVFWICVHDQKNFMFLKPVKVTIPHFLDLENDSDIQSLGLTFLSADHSKNSKGMYKFRLTDGVADFKTLKTHGVLKTSHFCSLCIGCRDSTEVLTRTKFCITSVIPKHAISPNRKQYAIFFITFYNLSTYLTKVDEVIKEKGLEHYRKRPLMFNFKTETKSPALEMIITKPEYGHIGCEGNTVVFRSDVDFGKTAKKILEGREKRDLYPPRFEVFLVSSPEKTNLNGGKITFRGAKSPLEYDIYLEPTPLSIETQTGRNIV